jgi:hypothetical protein
LGPEREIDDPALQRMKLGPNVEPPENELLKAPPEADEVAATGGPAAPETFALVDSRDFPSTHERARIMKRIVVPPCRF